MTSEYIQVINAVNTSKIRIERDDKNDEIIIIPSYTMPDDIVMNGVLYPKEEIETSYRGLEGTPAPIGHPHDSDGNYVSASSEIGVNRFMHGVFNGRVERHDGRIYVEKRVNVNVASRTEQGKRLIRILRDIMDGLTEDPIHTSTGVFIKPQQLPQMRVSESGKEYQTIARGLVWDHDAILLDEEGAATPFDGVGMLVNQGEQTHVMRVNCSDIANTGQTSYHMQDDNKPTGANMALRDKLIGFFKANKVDVAEDASDAILLDHLEAMQVNEEIKPEINHDELIGNALTEALKPVTEKLESFEAKFNAMDEEKKKALLDKLKGNGYDEEAIANMSDEDMEKNASIKANSDQEAEFGVPEFKPNHSSDSAFSTNLEEWGN